jgi:hypothetical protein
MNEEEKKAIEILNTFEFRGKTRNYKEISSEDSKSIKIVLNLLGKLQKWNEELKIKNNAIKRESEAYAEDMIRLDNELNLEKEKSKYEWIRQNCLSQELVNKLYIPIQKIKDKIEKLNSESYAEKLEDIMNRKNYTITELVQYVLRELIEDEINIDSIEEYKQEHTERCIDIDIRNKMNEILQAVKQIDKRVKKLED